MIKKAQTPIATTILVIAIIALVTLSIFYFIQKTKVNARVTMTAKALDNVYSREEQVSFYSLIALKFGLVKAFDEIAKGKEYDFVDKANCKVFNGKVEFCGLNPTLNEDFKKLIVENFIKEINFLVSDETGKSLKDLKNIIDNKKFEISYDGVAKIKEEFNISDNTASEMEVNYKKELFFETSLDEVRLDSFQDIFDKASKCVQENKLSECEESGGNSAAENIKNCIILENFDVEVKFEKGNCEDKYPYFLIKLESKKAFYIEQLRKIKLEFLM